MKYLLTGAAALALLTGCNNQGGETVTDKVQDEVKDVVEARQFDLDVRAGDPSSAGAALTALSLSESGAGRVAFGDADVSGAKATFTDVVISSADTKDSPLKAGKLVVEGLGMQGEQATFSKLTLSDITLEAKDTEVIKTDSAEVDFDDAEISGRIGSVTLLNPSPETAAWVASLMGNGAPADLPVGAALAFDQWKVEDISIDMTDTEEGESGAFLVDSVEILGMKDEKAGRISLDNLRLDMKDSGAEQNVAFNIGEIAIDGADLQFIEAISQNTDNEEDMAMALMDVVNRNPVDPGYDRVEVSNINAAVEGATFAMPKMEAYVRRNDAGQPTKIVTDTFKMTMSADANGGELGQQLAGGLAMIGYEKLELNGAGEADYDPDTDTIEYNKNKTFLELEDGFRMSFGGKIEGMSDFSRKSNQAALAAGGDDPDPEAMLAAAENLVIHNFSFELDDKSIVDRAFNAYAAQSGEDPEQARQQIAGLLAMAPLMAGGSGIDMGLVSETTSALSGFITDPGTLTISVNPAEPLRVSELAAVQDPSALTKDYLGFSATHEK